VRNEILAELLCSDERLKREEGASGTAREGAVPHTALSANKYARISHDEIDASTLAELPEDVRREVLAELASQAGQAPTSSAGMRSKRAGPPGSARDGGGKRARTGKRTGTGGWSDIVVRGRQVSLATLMREAPPPPAVRRGHRDSRSDPTEDPAAHAASEPVAAGLPQAQPRPLNDSAQAPAQVASPSAVGGKSIARYFTYPQRQ